MSANYTDDPQWQQAWALYLDPPGTTPTERHLDRVRAALEMCAIEERAEQ